MRVWKRERVRNGKKVKAKTHTGRYKLPWMSKSEDVALRVGDKRVAMEMLRAIVKQAELEHVGLAIPQQHIDAAARKLTAWLKDWQADLRLTCKPGSSRPRTVGYNLPRLFKECGWVYFADITVQSFTAWRRRQGLAQKTLNEYLGDIRALLNWMVKQEGIPHNPLDSVDMFKVEGHERRKRKTLTAAEFRKLLNVSGRRGIVYLVAMDTSLRRTVLYELTWADLHIDQVDPFIAVPAIMDKECKARTKPISQEAAAVLRMIRPENAVASHRVFKGRLNKKGLQHIRAPCIISVRIRRR